MVGKLSIEDTLIFASYQDRHQAAPLQLYILAMGWPWGGHVQDQNASFGYALKTASIVTHCGQEQNTPGQLLAVLATSSISIQHCARSTSKLLEHHAWCKVRFFAMLS